MPFTIEYEPVAPASLCRLCPMYTVVGITAPQVAPTIVPRPSMSIASFTLYLPGA